MLISHPCGSVGWLSFGSSEECWLGGNRKAVAWEGESELAVGCERKWLVVEVMAGEGIGLRKLLCAPLNLS